MLRPIGGRALLVVALDRRIVILRIVAEDRATLFELAPVANQNVPVMVSDLMAEMAEQATIGLGQFRPAFLNLGAIGFRAIVTTPLSCPVITLWPEGKGGSARNLKANPCAPSSARVRKGSFHRSRL